MNAPEQLSQADLIPVETIKAQTKPVLVKLARSMGWSGDDARTAKSEIEMWLVGTDPLALAIAFSKLREQHADLFSQKPAPVTKPAPAAAGNKLVEALLEMIPQQPVDMESVEALVDSKIEAAAATIVETLANKIEPRVDTVFVRPNETQHKIEGEAHAKLKHIVGLASIRTNILMVGPAGCGKTHLAEQAAQALGLEFSSISCTAGMSESQLLGWLLPIGDGGKFEYVQSEFIRLYENGGVYLLDEMDGADANTLMILNQALANGGFYVPQARRMVKRHPDFVCIAAANTYGHGGDMVYAGRERLDTATLDRFKNGVVTMDYDKKLEAKLIDPEVLEWGLAIRRQINSLKIRRVMSTRVLIGFSKQKQALGFGVKEWEESYFADWTRDELNKIGR